MPTIARGDRDRRDDEPERDPHVERGQHRRDGDDQARRDPSPPLGIAQQRATELAHRRGCDEHDGRPQQREVVVELEHPLVAEELQVEGADDLQREHNRQEPFRRAEAVVRAERERRPHEPDEHRDQEVRRVEDPSPVRRVVERNGLGRTHIRQGAPRRRPEVRCAEQRAGQQAEATGNNGGAGEQGAELVQRDTAFTYERERGPDQQGDRDQRECDDVGVHRETKEDAPRTDPRDATSGGCRWA